MNLDQIFKSTAKIKVKNSGLKWAPHQLTSTTPLKYETDMKFSAILWRISTFFSGKFFYCFFWQIHKETDQDDHQTETE